MKTVLGLLSCMVLTGCANPYTQFYTELMPEPYPPGVEPLVGEPEVIAGSDIGKDEVRMHEDGYLLVGYSGFTASDATDAQAAQQARMVNASKVIVYSEYQSTKTGVAPLTLPTTNYSTTNYSGNVYGGGSYATYNGTGTTTTYGQQTTYIPYSVDTYEHFASYWSKNTKFRLGVYVDDLSADERALIQSNTGVKVTAVVKKTPAFYAEIFRGDILKTIAGKVLADTEDLPVVVDRNLGKEVKIEILRNGKLIEKSVQLAD